MTAKKIAIAALALGTWLAPASAAPAAPAAPAWQLSLIPLPTNFAPGSVGTTTVAPNYQLVATNIGAAPTEGPIALAATFPAGIVPLTPEGGRSDRTSPNPVCTASGQTVACTAAGPVHPGHWVGASIPVEVALGAEAGVAEASVSGGRAASVATTSPVRIGQSPGFGFLPGPAGLNTLLTNADGSPAVQAGSHPDQLTVSLGFTTEQERAGSLITGAGHLRDVATDLPRGLIANPAATSERCTEAELISEENTETKCPPGSQIGTIVAMTEVTGPALPISALYNMVPPPGVPAELGFDALGVGIFVHLDGSVRSNGDYGLSAAAQDILARPSNPILSVQAQIWGDPSNSGHDGVRGKCRDSSLTPCTVTRERTPLLSMPSACSGPLTTTMSAKSWEEPGVSRVRSAQSTDLHGNPVGVNGCSLLEFEPSLSLRPEVSAAESPSGVHVDLHVPQSKDLSELATANLKDTKVVLPPGLAVNPAAAGGLAACSPAQIDLREGTEPGCPAASKVGSVEVDTPLLDHPVPGAVYVAAPYDNPFDSLLAIYVVVDDPQTGVVIKLAGKTEADPATGQLTTSFAEAPELPFEDFKVDLFGGPGGVLRTPATCGTFETESEETPWSGTAPVHTSDSFAINRGANGSPCVTSEAEMPNTPGFEAGTLTPIAASYSPFVGRLHREDGTQQLKSLNLTLPPGLSGKLAGIPVCPEATIAAAAARTGAAELASPSCPAASQVGEVTVGAGAGSQPYYTTGKIYLTGPYGGAPLSAAVITPAVAGPFDLGTVVTRATASLDPVTAQITVKSDPVPHILQGIPLEIRDVRVNLNRPQFTLNPTSCDPLAISGEAISVLDRVAPLSQRFQAGGCRGLDFKPSLALRLHGGTRRGAHPKLRAVLTAKGGEANIARAVVALPHSEFLDQAHIRTVCTRVQFAAKRCPAGAVYGHARAITPLLDEALEGPVYLRSSSHELPDLVAVLRGPASRPIEIELPGRIDSINGGIRSTFSTVPDQPVSKFVLTMQGAKKGLLINSTNLCTSTNRATVKLNGQNGKTHDFSPELTNDCGKSSKKKPRRHRG
ncbi:MAG TPA: hypothetical protein VGN84_02170 [Solirubrobacterales bacterium]|jgi:hypothetical protein|nr:hypothetical protein [Solirubrobacterales bacterium]